MNVRKLTVRRRARAAALVAWVDQTASDLDWTQLGLDDPPQGPADMPIALTGVFSSSKPGVRPSSARTPGTDRPSTTRTPVGTTSASRRRRSVSSTHTAAQLKLKSNLRAADSGRPRAPQSAPTA